MDSVVPPGPRLHVLVCVCFFPVSCLGLGITRIISKLRNHTHAHARDREPAEAPVIRALFHARRPAGPASVGDVRTRASPASPQRSPARPQGGRQRGHGCSSKPPSKLTCGGKLCLQSKQMNHGGPLREGN
eukprot:363614-Chlamydomonas_euryale.AAC.7